jgi:hypothetical protein
LENPRLHEYICDYIDGKMDKEMLAIFEDFIQKNETVRKFVQAAVRGRNNLALLRTAPDNDSGLEGNPVFRAAKARIMPFSFTLMVGVMFMIAISS